MKALDIALILTFVTLLGFVVCVVVCNINDIQIQDTLISMFLGIVGAEIAACGGIQIFKNKRKKLEEESDNGQTEREIQQP